MAHVRFNEERNKPLPDLQPRSLDKVMVKMGLVKSTTEAKGVLFLLFLIIGCCAAYYFSQAIPKDPQLGQDVPRHGEVIPSNRSI